MNRIRGGRKLKDLIRSIRCPQKCDPSVVQAHIDDLTKPRGALGRLEQTALRLAKVVGDPPSPLDQALVVVAAGDHGVVANGVSAYPPEVTGQMCRNIADGGAAVSVFARALGASVLPVDFGVSRPVGHPGVVDLNVRRGTRDLSRESAMIQEETEEAILSGARLIADRRSETEIVLLGEMGIGNTTAAAAVTAACLSLRGEQVVGSGTGIGPERLALKTNAINAGLDRLSGRSDLLMRSDPPGPFEVLRELGGLEIAGLVGVTLGAAAEGLPVISDGVIATAAVLIAIRLCPNANDYVFASHLSTEPAHQLQLEALGLEPLLDLNLRLGEGTGAVLALPLIRASGHMLAEMATFSGARVSGRTTGGTR